MSRHRVTRGALLALLAAAALLLIAAPAALAAGSFTGGFTSTIDYPRYVANDHTVYAVRFTNTAGLANNQTYYVKVRFFVTQGTPGSDTNRGFVWNPTTNQWIQERDGAWTDFPTVTTDAGGLILGGDAAGTSPWFFVKFGDTAVTGTRYLAVSLSIGGSNNTLNCTSQPEVTVFDPATAGYWVHNKATTTETGDKRLELSGAATVPPVTTPFALLFSEPNLCDDNADGTVDNEGQALYGTGADAAGDFRMAMPITDPTTPAPFWILFQKKVSTKFVSGGVAWGQNFANTTPDVDLALDAVTDITPPTAPSNLAETAEPGKVTLTWGAAIDGGGPIDHYTVYRWTDSGATTSTSAKQVVGTVPASSPLTLADTTVVAGTKYYYEVRAEDAQTNVGPRSATVQAVALSPTTLALAAPPATVAYKAKVTLTGTLSFGSAQALAGQTVLAESSLDGTTWASLGTCTAGTAAGTYVFDVHPAVKTWYRLTFAQTASYIASTSEPRVVTPRLQMLGTPAAPFTVERNTRFTVSGFAKPHLTNGARSVIIQCFRKVHGKWVVKKLFHAKNAAHASYTKYSVKVSLDTTGTWKLRAYFPATSTFAKTYSGYRTVRVTR